MLAPVLVIPPGSGPVDLAAAKAHLRVDGTDDDLIQALLDAATAHLDGWSGILGRCLIDQTWRQDFACWPAGGVLRLPFPNVSSIAWVKYYDFNNDQQTVTSTAYQRLEDARGSYLQFTSTWSAPSLYDRPDPVSVQFVAGYGDAAAVPADIRLAILLSVGAWYQNREEIAPSGTSLLPFGAQALLAKYRRVGV